MSSFNNIFFNIKDNDYRNRNLEKIKIKKNKSSDNLLKKNKSSDNLLRKNLSLDNFMKFEWPWLI